MPKDKLTLSMERRVIQKAKRVAELRHSSVSSMVSEYLDGLDDEEFMKRLSPRVREMVGIVTLPEGKTYRELLEEALTVKYQGTRGA